MNLAAIALLAATACSVSPPVEVTRQPQTCGLLGAECCPYDRECLDEASVDKPSNVVCDRAAGHPTCATCGGAGQPCCPAISGYEACGYPNACDPKTRRCERAGSNPRVGDTPLPAVDEVNGMASDLPAEAGFPQRAGEGRGVAKAAHISRKW